ncbi:tetratricopeptide repeat protein 33 isoform X1 [Juglans microcarpa x Juglans regia]|uniref:tetratricopeptide repeat protein 33 isoform X1 n=1 Tax=Juglans microcarpa x Juglans regia TaxID=2249226 RepID=UPI001B7E2183|nr:tetratricopeptide repeat protein 33 isoform X1 [Juglans microcarpa x Juglans regia]
MKLTWKNNSKNSKKRSLAAVSNFPNLPFEHHQEDDEANNSSNTQLKKKENGSEGLASLDSSDSSDAKQLAQSFQTQGNKLAEDGKYREALGKWEAALTLIPELAVLHEQKAQILLEIGDSWNSLKAATRATELEPSWAEAWVTLGRAQLNFGEPDSAIESFDKALSIKGLKHLLLKQTETRWLCDLLNCEMQYYHEFLHIIVALTTSCLLRVRH